MKTTTLTATRRQINAPGFDPSFFLSNQVANISLEGIEPEKKLLQLFDDLFHHLDDLAQEIEGEVVTLQESAWNMETSLFQDLDDQYDKLTEVGSSVDSVKESFDHASDGAVRVGGRLAISDRERANIDKSIELLSYVAYFENIPEDVFGNVLAMNSTKLKENLPGELRAQDWGTISKVFHDLRIIAPYDPDTKSTTLQKANKLIDSLAGVVEMELLGQFDGALNDLMEDPNDSQAVLKARSLAESLYLFNGGLALQKRYIFGVVQRRIPNDAFFRNERAPTGILAKVRDLAAMVQRPPPGAVGSNVIKKHEDDDSSAGYSDNEEVQEMQRPTMHAGDQSMQLIDHLSGLFQMINTVCVEQFSLIRKIFPSNTIPQVTRSLVQRVFSDPAFGIQARVDSILCPPQPSPKLPLADYLDALLTVREKLTALNVLLLECSTDPSMRGMGSEGESLRRAKRYSNTTVKQRELTVFGRARQASRPEEVEKAVVDDEDIEERMRSDIEIREFFEDQISQVLGGYVSDYFDKELLHTRSQYGSILRRAVDDTPALGRVAGGTLIHLPTLRAEKMKSISLLVKTVANRNFLNSVFTITTDAILRMESIGRDDRKLPVCAKDLFIIHLSFLTDGLMIPWSRACTTMLLKICATKAANTSLPPMDLLPAVVALIYGKNQIKTHFDTTFMRALSTSPNLVVVCKEARRKTFKNIVNLARECLHAWTLGVAFHIEKLLSSLQSKYDYAPKFDPINNMLNGNKGSTNSTAACDAVCKAIIHVTNTIRNYETQLVGIDMQLMFWKPFGSQCMGNLISHLRKQKITTDGSMMLLRDLQEYKHVMALMSSAEAMDMMTCLEDICGIFAVESDEVAQMVVDDFRHLDTSIVLALVRSRADFGGKGSKDAHHWSRILSSTFMNYKWESPLPWEARKPFTVLSFTESLNSGQSLRQLGPSSLRKASGNMSALYKREVLRPSSVPRERPNSMLRPTSVAFRKRSNSNSGAIALDLNALESEDAEFHIRAAETDFEISKQTEQLQQPRLVSKFLPSRPDDAPADAETRRGSNGTTPTSVARPDKIMGSRSLARSNSVDRIGAGSNNNSNLGIAGNGVARKSTTGSCTAPTTPAAATKMNPILAARKSALASDIPPPPASHLTSPKSSMLSKMTSFFGANK